MITKEYILQCEKAREIQENWKPSKWDLFIMYKKHIDIVLKYTPETFHLSPCIRGTDNNCRIGIQNVIWLPTQAQLQEMIDWPGSILIGHIPNNMLMLSYAYQDTRIKVKGTSMEQLWLAFVMKELYSKQWNGKDWEKN